MMLSLPGDQNTGTSLSGQGSATRPCSGSLQCFPDCLAVGEGLAAPLSKNTAPLSALRALIFGHSGIKQQNYFDPLAVFLQLAHWCH